MRDRKVIVSVDGPGREVVSATAGLPQGSPISPILFAISIAEIHGAVESQVEQSRGISFVDDITWVAEGENASDVAHRLESCAASLG